MKNNVQIEGLLTLMAHLAHHLGVNPKLALKRVGGKFERRFRVLEKWVYQ